MGKLSFKKVKLIDITILVFILLEVLYMFLIYPVGNKLHSELGLQQVIYFQLLFPAAAIVLLFLISYSSSVEHIRQARWYLFTVLLCSSLILVLNIVMRNPYSDSTIVGYTILVNLFSIVV